MAARDTAPIDPTRADAVSERAFTMTEEAITDEERARGCKAKFVLARTLAAGDTVSFTVTIALD